MNQKMTCKFKKKEFSQTKRCLSLILSLTLILTVCACNNNNDHDDDYDEKPKSTVTVTNPDEVNVAKTNTGNDSKINKSEGTVNKTPDVEKKTHDTSSQKAPEPKDETKIISIGETVTSANYEFTLNNVELSYDVMPDNPPSYYTHYPASSGQVYIHIDSDVKNTKKQSIECDNVYSVTADYNDGYSYKGFAVAEDSGGDFTYASITSVDPLQTLGIHQLIECPQEVETNTDTPLFVILNLSDGTKYKYIIR